MSYVFSNKAFHFNCFVLYLSLSWLEQWTNLIRVWRNQNADTGRGASLNQSEPGSSSLLSHELPARVRKYRESTLRGLKSRVFSVSQPQPIPSFMASYSFLLFVCFLWKWHTRKFDCSKRVTFKAAHRMLVALFPASTANRKWVL